MLSVFPLGRISTKRVVPNVALRRKEFELKANESNEWRRLSSGEFGFFIAYYGAGVLNYSFAPRPHQINKTLVGFQRIPLLNIFTRTKSVKKGLRAL